LFVRSEKGKRRYRVPPVALLENLNDSFQLLFANFGSLSCFALLEGFSDAEDNFEACVEGGACLGGGELGGLFENRAALRVTYILVRAIVSVI
jgi:hypothetical protein